MNNLFNMDNAFFTFLSKVCDILILSVIWVIVCIPVITIGPACSALYYATVKVVRRERGYLMREFFKSFRMNFKRGAIVGVALTVIFSILAIDLIATWSNATGNTSVSSVFIGIYAAIAIFVSCFAIYVFPVLSRFDMNLKQLIKAAAFMSIKHFLFTLLMLVIQIAAIAAVLVMPISLVFIPATACFLNSLVMERILKKYIPKSDETEETVKDEWYLE